MKQSITPNQIKENNRNLIYQYIYKHEKVSQQDIAYDLHLSRPTVTTNLMRIRGRRAHYKMRTDKYGIRRQKSRLYNRF